jgi:gliding motility-associated-like protein
VAQNYVFAGPVAATSYSWTRAAVTGISNPSSNGVSNSITEVLTNTTNVPITVTYNVTPIAAGCFNPVPFNYVVTVNPTPNVTSAANGTVCSAQSDSYTITGNVTGSAFAWSRAAVAGISNSATNNQSSNPIVESLINTTSNIINVDYVIVPTANGCTGPAFTYSKAVKPTPQKPAPSNNGPLCVGSDLTLSALPFPGATYNWTGPNGFTSSAQNPPTITGVSYADSGIYIVTATINGCTGPADSTKVNISNAPSTASATGDTVICAGNTVMLFGNISGGSSTGAWTTSGSGNFSPSNTFLTTTYTPSNSDTAAHTVVLTLTSTNNGVCPAASWQHVLRITSAPTVNAGSDTTICSFKTVDLNGTITVASGGIWSTSGNGTFNPSPTALNASYILGTTDIIRGNVTLTLTTTGTGGCKVTSDEIKATIIPAPTVNAGPDWLIHVGTSVTLQPTITGPAIGYQWTPNIWINNTTQPTAIVTPQQDTTYAITVTGQGGCTSTDSVKIVVLFPPEIPNVFSPNGDNINDKWNIRALAKYPGCTVQIFTRYGQLIYNSVGYDNPWDGTFNGKPMPVGTYYYIVDPKNGVQRFAGYVVLLR